MVPTIGRIVHYRPTAVDVDQINRRRTTSKSIIDRIADDSWPLGAQAHIGLEVFPGDIIAGFVTAVLQQFDGDERVNLSLQLDGSDTYWVTSVPFGIDEVGSWDWPPQV